MYFFNLRKQFPLWLYVLTVCSVYYKLKKYNKAIEDFNKALETEQTVKTYNHRGNCFRKLKKYNEAIQDFDKAIELNPNEAINFNRRGWCYCGLAEYNKALEDFNKAVELNPDNKVFLRSKRMCCHKLKEV